MGTTSAGGLKIQSNKGIGRALTKDHYQTADQLAAAKEAFIG